MNNFLHGEKVCVSGADGFIGSHLVENLVARGAKVRALVYYNSWNSIGWLSELSKELLSCVEVLPGDIRDLETVTQLISGCSHVYHLSSLIGIPYSYQAPRSYVDTNITGALNVLEACRSEKKLEKLVHVSTSEVYGSAQIIPIPETHPLVAQSPYSASKIAADQLAESFSRSFGLPVSIARPFNTFGPRQTARAVIPTIASQLLSGVTEIRLGSLSPTRDFNFVDDTVAGLIAISGASDAVGKTINIGSGQEWSIADTVDKIIKLCGVEAEVVLDPERLRPDSSEVTRLVADNHLIKSITDWSSEVNFEDGLARTIGWIKDNLRYFDAAHYKV